MNREEINRAVEAFNARSEKPLTVKAALIDMDGTLLDSMPNHASAWHRMMSEEGFSIPRDEFVLYEGMTGRATIKQIFKRDRGFEPTDAEADELYARKARYFNEMPPVVPIPGAARMLRFFMDNGIRRVLVTGSKQISTLDRLDTDFPGAFPHDLRITARDVKKGKPTPEPYFRGMELGGVNYWESVVIENAPLGVESGHRAGAFVLAAATGPIPLQALTDAGADLAFPSMDALVDALPALIEATKQ